LVYTAPGNTLTYPGLAAPMPKSNANEVAGSAAPAGTAAMQPIRAAKPMSGNRGEIVDMVVSSNSRSLWGRLVACGRVALGRRRLPIAAPDAIRPHNW